MFKTVCIQNSNSIDRSLMAEQPVTATSEKEATPPAMDDDELTIDDLGAVVEKMWNARTKWYFIGVRFGLMAPALDAIDADKKGVANKMTRMVKEWLNEGENCNWKAVFSALKHPTVAIQPVKGKKRKTTPTDHVLSKKVKTNEAVMCARGRGPYAPSPISGAAVAIHKDNAYFAAGCDIHVFHLPSRDWTETIHCQREMFGLATIGDELGVVGGHVIAETSGSGNEVSNKIACLSLTASNEQHTWEEKYPAMNTARIYPQVVVTGNHLIALGGWTEWNAYGNKYFKPTNSVEVLDLERKCWYCLSLPEVFTTMKWQSACVCDKNLFVAVRHDDPNFHDTVSTISESRELTSIKYFDPFDVDRDSAYQCISMYRCPVKTLLQVAQAAHDDTSTNKSKILWQELQNPHPPDGTTDCEGRVKSECAFTLACINNHTLIAVGCNHIEATTAQDVKSFLYDAYESYRIRQEDLCDESYYDSEGSESEIMDEKCHIYVYDVENDSWEELTFTTDNGLPNDQASVAVINSTIIIVRNSRTVHICNNLSL